jgi:hypothetical protein
LESFSEEIWHDDANPVCVGDFYGRDLTAQLSFSKNMEYVEEF